MAFMVGVCDLLGTSYAPVSKIPSVKGLQYLNFVTCIMQPTMKNVIQVLRSSFKSLLVEERIFMFSLF